MSSSDRPMPRWVLAPLPPDEEQRLAVLRNYEILDTPPEAVFDHLAWLASYICGTPMALVNLVDEHRQWFKARVGFPTAESPRSEAICAYAILNPQQVLEITDTSKDDRFADMPAIAGHPFVRFYAGAPLVSASGHAVGTLCVMDSVPKTLTDDQRQALIILAAQAVSQFELRRRLRDIEDQRAQLISTLNAVPIAIVIRGAPDGRVVVQNEAADRFAGSTNWETIRALRKDGQPLSRTEWPGFRALRGETVRSEELRLTMADGRTVPVYANAAPITDSRGAIVGAVTGFQDITSLAEVARLKDEFVATVSHELRTPLTAIKGSLQLVHSAEGLDAEHKELIGVALGNADRLVRMVNDILDAAKIEAGALKLQRRTLTVAVLAATAFENVRPIAAAAGVRLAIEIESGVRAVHVDVDRMVQALVNLLSNAIKFAPRATTVTLAARRMADGGVSMAIHDDGSGIPPERLHRLFEKFSQLQPGSSNQGKGTGLGLAITKALVEEHGGTIHVSSDPGMGTTFEIRLAGDGTSFAAAAAPLC